MINDLRFVERDGKRILQAEYQVGAAVGTDYEYQWEDVPLVVESIKACPLCADIKPLLLGEANCQQCEKDEYTARHTTLK